MREGQANSFSTHHELLNHFQLTSHSVPKSENESGGESVIQGSLNWLRKQKKQVLLFADA